MKNYTYTALTTIKVGGKVIKEGESVILDEATGAGLVDEKLVEQESDEAVEVAAPVVTKPVVAKKAAAPVKKKAAR